MLANKSDEILTAKRREQDFVVEGTPKSAKRTGRSVTGNNQDAPAMSDARNGAYEAQRGWIGEMQVLEDLQHRRMSCLLFDHVAKPFVEKMPGRLAAKITANQCL